MPVPTTQRTAAAIARASALHQGQQLGGANWSARDLREIVATLAELMVVLFEQVDDDQQQVAEVRAARNLLELIVDGVNGAGG